MELDSLDRRILYLLDEDGRASYKEIAKKTKSSPEVIRYRAVRLIENKVIKNFMTLINFSQLGYIGHGIFCRFKTEKNKEKLFQYLKSHERIYWIAEFGGRYDLALAFMAKDSLEFYDIFSKIKEKTAEFLTGLEVAIRIQLTQYPRGYLMSEQTINKGVFPYFGKALKHEKFYTIDFSILKALSQNARLETIKIADITGIPASTVAFRIKKLREDKIIQGFSPQVSCQNFGYQSFQLFIEIEDLDDEKRKLISSYCQANPNIVFLIETLGKWNFEIIYEVKDQKEFQNQMTHLREAFPWIKNIEAGIIFDHYVKYDQFPLEKIQ